MKQKGTSIICNGEIHSSDARIVTADNRCFRYGEGIFETMRVIDGRIIFASAHFNRLFEGMRLLKFEIPALFSEVALSKQIMFLLKKNNHETSARVRLQVFGKEEDLFNPDYVIPNYVIQTWRIENVLELNETGYTVGIYSEAKKSCDSFSNIKSCNYLPYLMAARYAAANKWNDSLVMNTSGRVCESTIANIFWIKSNHIFTPPLSEGCVAGIMRSYLLAKRESSNLEISEKLLEREELLQADEIFLTNAVNGLRWIQAIGKKQYHRNLVTQVFDDFMKNIID